VIDFDTIDDRPLDVLFVPPWRFHTSPQVGVALHLTWSELARWLSQPSVGNAKDEAGAWSPALYEGDVRRKSALISIGALVVDIDEAGDVDVAANVLVRYSAIVHETFSSANDAPRCRIVLRLAEPINAQTYERVHRIVRARLNAAELPPDEGAKDASRLSYSPVRGPDAGYRFRRVDGAPLDARAVLAAQPLPPARPSAPLPPPKHRNAYVRGALRKAASAVASASEGSRHYALSREAFTLARLLGVDEGQIASALLPAFVASAGERREHEGRRTICDAVRARRGAA
jgi:hypothetical protein